MKQKTVGISQKAFVFRKDGRFLTMRRTETAPSNPLKWDLPGGDIEYGEVPLKAIQREIREETGLLTKELSPFGVEAYTYPSSGYWVTIAYKTSISGGKLAISWEHDLYKWVTLDEFLKLRLPEKIRKFTKILKSNRGGIRGLL
jgi:8-oxo-dGTP diphosphatase